MKDKSLLVSWSSKYSTERNTTKFYFSWSDNTLDNFNLNNVSAFISGHTHWSYDFNDKNTRFISNQLGYKSELGSTGLNEDGLYEIEIIS